MAKLTPWRLDRDSEALLVAFGCAREAEGASTRSAIREMSQIRSVLRELAATGGPVPAARLAAVPERLAGVLCEPAAVVALSTARSRYVAVQRFVRFLSRQRGTHTDADAALAVVAARLPTRASAGWHTEGVVLGGARGRRRRRGPTLLAADLCAIADGIENSGFRGTRDRALVALHCFSGLRPGEIVSLAWEQLGEGLLAYRYGGLTARVSRGGREVSLILLPQAATPVAALRELAAATGHPSGAVFRRCVGSPRPLTERAAHAVVRRSQEAAGLPPVGAAGLRAAFAQWLRSAGLSDHEVRDVLGLARVRTVDQLLQPHAALEAQRWARKVSTLASR